MKDEKSSVVAMLKTGIQNGSSPSQDINKLRLI
jgi:hypothetical protein